MTLQAIVIRGLLVGVILGWFIQAKKWADWVGMLQERKAYHFQMGILLPNVIDTIALYLSAGLNLTEAIRRAAKAVSQPMEAELDRLARDLSLGMSVTEAVDLFVKRTGCQGGGALSLVFQQADRFGNETVSKLKQLSASLRDKRLNELDRATKTAPIKMLLPMVLCIFPALLIVLFTPVLIRSGLLSWS
ncbi:MAG: type II secretion system F family protein [Firmicutes bacterium]|nr:type II secretion system F family protein [Bacillota bacterium]